jgi:hypothetical protein
MNSHKLEGKKKKITTNRIVFNSSKSTNKGGLSMSSKKNDKGREMVNVSVLSTSNRKTSHPNKRKINLRTPHVVDKGVDRNSSLSLRYRGILSSKEKNEPYIR